MRDDVVEAINNLFKSKNKRHREEDIIVDNNNLLNIKNKDNNSSSSSSSFLSSSIILTSRSERDFSNVNPKFKDELNLDLNQSKLVHFIKEKIVPLFDDNVTLNVPTNYPFVDLIGTNFNRNDYSTNCCLFNYNGVLYCYIYDNIDLLTSFKNKLEIIQCFQLQKLQNTKLIMVEIYIIYLY
jgi:hypothetical protein